MFPLARQENLTVEHLPDETLIYDRTSGKAHCLNRTAAFVWKNCDGKTSIRELASRLQRESGARADEAVVELAIEQLRRRNLLAADATPAGNARRLGRRELLRGLTLATLPLVMTLTAKGLAAGLSTTTTTTTPSPIVIACTDGAPCTVGGSCGTNSKGVPGFCQPPVGATGAAALTGQCSC